MKDSPTHPYLKYLQFIVLMAVVLFNFSPISTTPVYAASPANDAWQNATVISIPFSDAVDTNDAQKELDEPVLGPALEDLCNGIPLREGLNTVWYKYVAPATPASALVYMDTLGSTQTDINPFTGKPYIYDTYIAVYTGTPSGNPTLVACNDDNDAGSLSQVGFTALANTTYYIQVAQYNGRLDVVYEEQPYFGGNLKFHATTFQDVPGDYWAWRFIEGLYNAGVTGGCVSSPRQYCSATTVTRDQMAVFLLRAKHGPVYTPPAVGASTGFGDVPTTYWAAAWIKQLAAEGVTGGCGSGNYCPAINVTRDQMAVFLLRAKYGPAYTPPAVGASTGFGDVPTSYWAGAWIKQLAAEGITGGCGGGNYCPATAVTRDQMAIFIDKTFNISPLP